MRVYGLLVCAAIERAMAYLDTGELPWDMDIFNQVRPASLWVSNCVIVSKVFKKYESE